MSTRRRGFTLIELLVVIGIIGTIVSLMLPAIQGVREAARMMTCKSNLRQVGIALHNYHEDHRQLPPGWTSDDPEEGGWGWAARLLPFIEQGAVTNSQIDFELPIDDEANRAGREVAIALYLCPSDPMEPVFVIGAGDDHDHSHDHEDDADDDHGDHAEEEHDDHDDHDHGHDHSDGSEHNIDVEGEPLFAVGRSNYAGVFGDEEIAEDPSNGSGTFFHDSEIRFGSFRDGLSNTILVGERSSQFGGTTWVGVVHGAAEPMARVVGATDHRPNEEGGHFDDFSSFHRQGAHFLFGDGAVRTISDKVDREIYRGLATRAGRENVNRYFVD